MRIAAGIIFVAGATGALAANTPIQVRLDWTKTVITSKTVPTVFVNPQPPGKPGPDEDLRQIKLLGARNLRFQPLPSPLTQVIPELKPPTADSTSWDYTAMDACTEVPQIPPAGATLRRSVRPMAD